MSLPQNNTRPLVGTSSRLHNRSNVDLPDPDGPNTTVTPCFGMAALNPSSARNPARSTTTSANSNTGSVSATAYPISTAKRGLMTSSMIAKRSSKPMNADFTALMVNRSRSLQP